jgi:hypothetical protein
MAETHPKKRLLGYARVSTHGQTLDSQLSSFAPLDAGAGTSTRRRRPACRPTGASFSRCSTGLPLVMW